MLLTWLVAQRQQHGQKRSQSHGNMQGLYLPTIGALSASCPQSSAMLFLELKETGKEYF